MKKTLHGVFVNTDTDTFEKATLEFKNITDIYDFLKYDCLDMKILSFDNVRCLVFFDDAGKLKINPKPSIVIINHYTQKICDLIVGKCFICSINEDGDPSSLDDTDIVKILATTKTLIYPYHNDSEIDVVLRKVLVSIY